MKQYNVENFDRFKKDIENEIGKDYYYLVESIARKFNTSNAAAGVFTLEDLIQEGVIGLISALKKVDQNALDSSAHPDKTLKSFLSKRIKGAIRRALNINMSSIKIPEFQLNSLRRNPEENESLVLDFFNSKFVSLDNTIDNEGNTFADIIEDVDDNFKKERLTTELIDLMTKILTPRELVVIVHSFGINAERLPAKQIGDILGLKGKFNQIRVAELKKQALDKLSENLTYSQLVDLV